MTEKKDIKDYLHLYLGQKVQLHESRFSEPETDRLFTLSGVEENTFCVGETRLWYRIEVYHGIPIDLLALRPLSDMAEEETAAMNSMGGARAEDWTKFSKHQLYHAEQFQFLISRGFDLFGLIESGLAINKSSLKNS